MRVANFNCTGETVVDLFAGIGYFTLHYLCGANATVGETMDSDIEEGRAREWRRRDCKKAWRCAHV